MEAIDRELGYDAHVECPKCRAQGLVTHSGFVPELMYYPARTPHYHCTGVHGGLTSTELEHFGIDPSPPPDVPPSHEAGPGADPRHP